MLLKLQIFEKYKKFDSVCQFFTYTYSFPNIGLVHFHMVKSSTVAQAYPSR